MAKKRTRGPAKFNRIAPKKKVKKVLGKSAAKSSRPKIQPKAGVSTKRKSTSTAKTGKSKGAPVKRSAKPVGVMQNKMLKTAFENKAYDAGADAQLFENAVNSVRGVLEAFGLNIQMDADCLGMLSDLKDDFESLVEEIENQDAPRIEISNEGIDEMPATEVLSFGDEDEDEDEPDIDFNYNDDDDGNPDDIPQF